MTLEKLQAAARAMGQKEIEQALFSLADDPRFPAVLALMQQHRESYIVSGTQQSFANHHGPLAHNNGSIFALDTLRDAIRARVEVKKTKGGARPPED